MAGKFPSWFEDKETGFTYFLQKTDNKKTTKKVVKSSE